MEKRRKRSAGRTRLFCKRSEKRGDFAIERVGDDALCWLDARFLHKWKSGSRECGPRVRLRARRRKRGRLLEMSRMQLREQHGRARANGTGPRDNGGRRRGGIVILSRMASIYPRHASIEKPARLNVSVSPRPRCKRGFIARRRIDEERELFFFFFISRC